MHAKSHDAITIYKATFSKEQLMQLNREERALLVLLGQVANQLAVFWKLLFFATNGDDETKDRVQQLVEGSQTQILVRHTVGIAYEGWMLIQSRFLKTSLAKEYQTLLGEDGTNALADLKRYFGKKNAIFNIRNHFAFHHPDSLDVEQDLQEALSDSGLDSEWNWYLTETTINTHYFLSDLVITHGITRAAGFKDLEEAHRQVMKDLNQIVAAIGSFAQAYFYAVLAKYNSELTLEVCANVTGVASESVEIPFYVYDSSETGPPPKAGG